MYDTECLTKFDDNEVIIPSIGLEEVNRFKEESSERGFYAREIVKIFDELSEKNPLIDGVKLGKTLIRTSYDLFNQDISNKLTMNQNDYKIIACAKNNDAILITRDRMMRVIARDFVSVEEYQADKIKATELYKGYRKLIVPEQIITQLFCGELKNEFGLYQNEFLILESDSNPQHSGVGICKGNFVTPCDFDKITKALKMKLKPINLEQKMFLYLLWDKDISCVTCTGVSGKGKSLLAIDYALSSVYSQLFNTFLYTKSAIPVDSREYLGFTKGDTDEKLKPHVQPLYSSIEFLYKDELYKGKTRTTIDKKVEEFLENDILKFYPLANIRGMSIFDKVVMLDEAQNTTNHMIKSLVTRINDTSKLLVTGDIEQIDDKNLNMYNNGLTHLIEAGKDESFIGHITMDIDDKSKRGKLAGFGAKKL